MAHKKYIKRGGKVFGPYIYENYRENGVTKTRYLGKGKLTHEPKNKIANVFLFFLIFFAFVFAIYFFQFQITGKTILLDKTSFFVNEPISGKISLEFSDGSFYPSDSVVKILFNNRIEEMSLKEFFEMAGSNISETEANYYSPAFTEISGYGNGYGFLGEKEVPVDVYFELKVFKSLDDEKQEQIGGGIEEENQTQQEQQNQTGEEQEQQQNDETEQQIEENEEIVEQVAENEQQSKEIVNNEEGVSEPLVTANIIKKLFTGKAVKDNEDKNEKEDKKENIKDDEIKKEKIIDGKTKLGEQFVYELKNKESAEIVSGSIKTADGKILDYSILIISEEEDKIIVTTDYFEKEKGFGEDYATNKKHNVDLVLDIFNFTSNESGDFSVELSFEYNNISLLKESEKIYFEEKIAQIPEENITINETNITETNLTEINITGVEVITTQYNATIGKPVKWKKEIKLNEPKDIIIKIPNIAENVTIKKLRSDGSVYQEEEPETNLTEEINISEEIQTAEENASNNILLEATGLFSKITGFFVQEENQTSQDEVEINITTTANLTNYEIEYETPAPYSEENETKNGKQVKVVGLEEIKYENVLAFSEISEDFGIRNSERLEIFWLENETKISSLNISDLNGNGIYDYIEWVVPHLSNQTFNIIINITRAEHLNENKTFISDIYEEVKALDGIWSEEIPNAHYVSVSFERNLTSENDITIYPRVVNGSPRIEVYEINNEEIIAEFSSLNSNEYNKIYLTNLVGEQDSFDLRVVGGSIEIEHIIDPDVSDCGVLNTTNTLYTLIANPPVSLVTCFNVTVDNVTLDCNGFTLTGDNSSASYGVYSNSSNTTIKNCNILNFSTGIYYDTNSNGTIQNISTNTTRAVSGNNGYGVYLYRTNWTNITNSQANSSIGYGFFISTNSNQNNITNSNGTSISSKAIYIYSGSKNNSIINSTGASTSNFGIFLESSSNNSIINSTGTSGTGSNARGIVFDAVSNSTIINSNGIASGSYGIYIFSTSGTSNYNQIINSTGKSTSSIGIFFDTSAPKNIITNSTGNSSSDSGIYTNADYTQVINSTGIGTSAFGSIGLASSHNVLTNSTGSSASIGAGIYAGNTNNTITNSNGTGSSDYGIYLSSSNSTITNSNATSTSDYAVYITSSSNNTFKNLRANTSSSTLYSIYISNSNDTIFNDSIINSSSNTKDIYIDGTGVGVTPTNFTNVSFNKSAVAFGASSTGSFNVFWYLDVYTNDTSGNVLSGTNVSAWNVNNVLQFTELTNSSGYIARKTLREYMQNVTNKYFDTNYTANATKTDYNNATRQINLTQNNLSIITMTEGISPTISLSYPTQGLTTISTINFNWSASDNLDTSLTCNLTLDGVVNVSNIASANATYTNYTISNIADGSHSWNITCIDDAPNSNTSVTRTFNVDTTYPQIQFVSPTPANNSITTSRTAIINVSITEENLNELKWNWNGTNYSLSHDDLAVFYSTNNTNDTIYVNRFMNSPTIWPKSGLSNGTKLAMTFNNNSLFGECTIGNQAGCIKDLSTSGYDGVLGNSTSGTAPTWNSSGKYSGAYTFDGVDDFIETNQKIVPHNSSSGFTVSAWIYFVAPSSDGLRGIFSEEYDAANKHWGLLVNGSGYLQFRGWNSTGFIYLTNSSSSVINLSQWHLVTFTRTTTTLTMYVDGASVPITNTSGAITNGGVGNPTFRIGAYRNDSSTKFNGSIDDVMVWNRSLSTSEVLELYTSSLAKYNSSQWNLYINQSKNSTAFLDDGVYTYSAFANDSVGNTNQTETRTISINHFPQLSFVSPTPANNSITANRTAIINVSISSYEPGLDMTEFKWNWNGTNYTLYNNSLVLMMNFDNRSSLSECTIRNQADCIKDLSASGNDGILGNSTSGTDPTWNSSGKYSGAFSFDGSNDFFTLSTTDTSATNNFSFGGWFKTSATHEIDSEADGGLGGTSGQKYALYPEFKTNPDTGAGISVGTNGITVYEHSDDYMPPIAVYSATIGSGWNHIIVVYTNKQPKIYLNGALVRTGLTSNKTNVYGSFAGIGGGGWGYFNGSIDDVMVWNSSLTADKIYELYASSLTKYNSSAWNFYINQSKNATSLLDEGNYTYFAYSTTNASRENQTETRLLSIVLTPPTVTLPVYTNATQYRNNQSLIFNISVTSPLATLNNCSINVGGNSNQTLAVSNGWCNGTYALTGISDGNKTINAYANDSVGNIGFNNSYVVWIDSTAPEITLPVYTNATQKKSSNNLTLNISVSDAGVGVSLCRVYVSGQSSNQTIAYSNGWCNTTLNLTGSSQGNSTIYVYANDTLGNIGVNNLNVVWIDDTSTNVTLNSPANAYAINSSSVTFNCTAYDNANLSNVTLYTNFSGSWASNETNSSPVNNSAVALSENISDGNYIWNCQACDYVGNCNFSLSNRTIRIDTTVPSISNPYPLNNSFITSDSTALGVLTNENAFCRYSTSSGEAFASMTAFSTTGVLTHNSTLTGLIDNTTNNYYVKCNDTLVNVNSVDYYLRYSVDFNYPPNKTNLTELSNDTLTNNTNITLTWTNTTDLDGDTLYFDIEISNSTEFSYLFVNLTNRSSLNYSNTTLSDGTYYWKTRARDHIEPGNWSDIYKFILDTTAPTINSKNKTDVRQNNSAILNVNATDSLAGLSAGRAFVLFPNSTLANYTMSLSGNIFNLSLTNLSVVGDYDVNYSINDSAGNVVQTNDSFEVYIPLNVSGNTTDSQGNTRNYSFKFYKPGTSTLLYNFTNNSYNLTNDEIHYRTYDLKVETNESNPSIVILQNISMTSDNIPINIDNFTTINETITNYKVLRGVGINSSFSGNSTINLSYSGLFSSDFSAISESDLTVHKCSGWNYSGRACSGSFELYSSKTVYTGDDRAVINTTNFSSFVISEYTCGNGICQAAYGETTSTCSADCVVSSGTTSSGGGGGGTITALTAGALQISVDKLEVEVMLGKKVSGSITFMNSYGSEMELDISVNDELKDIIFIENKVDINASESKVIPVLINGTREGTFLGEIFIKGSNINRTIPVKVIVRGKEDKLLDLDLILDKKVVVPGEELSFRVILFNFGKLTRYDVALIYEVTNKETNESILSQREEVALETSLSLSRRFEIPKNISYGDYILTVEADYEVAKTKAYSSFKIKEFETPIVLQRGILFIKEYLPIIMTIIVVIFMFVIAGYYFTYLRKKLFEKKMEEIKKKSIYIFPDFASLPKSKFAYLGLVADTKVKTYLDHTQLNTHTLIAGGTGCGKTVAGMVIVEELLKKGMPVIIFDPVGQWTGFAKKNKNNKIKSLYRKFSMSGPRAFKSEIIEINDSTLNINIIHYMNKKGLTVFRMDKLTPKKADEFIENSLEKVYRARLPEKSSLGTLFVLDEVHRLLPKYGGRKAHLKLEQAVREFRKWGIGLLMISQVLTDFKGAIRGNIGTEIQMRSRYEGDIKRVRERHSATFSTLIPKMPTGIGMVESGGYNKGSPYFVEFRPPYHSLLKLHEEELQIHAKKQKPILEEKGKEENKEVKEGGKKEEKTEEKEEHKKTHKPKKEAKKRKKVETKKHKKKK